jgi:hypothetical protein
MNTDNNFKFQATLVAVSFEIIDILIPHSYEDIILGINFYMQKIISECNDDESIAVSCINSKIRYLLTAYSTLCKKYSTNSFDLSIIKYNLTNLLFVAWRINPEILYDSDICENYILGRNLPPFLSIFAWKFGLKNCPCYKYHEKLLQKILLDSADVRISGCRIK